MYLDDIQECLLFPGIGNRGVVIKAVTGIYFRPDTATAWSWTAPVPAVTLLLSSSQRT
jgi:hypothetical protein